jgi:hypothetical protein
LSLSSRKPSLDMRAILIQGDSVRMTWGADDKARDERKPLRRDALVDATPAAPARASDELLRLRLGEELDYVRRMLVALGDQLSGDPILIRRHAVALQSLDIVEQILGHVGNVIRSNEPHSAIESIGMGDLKARLTRSGSL